VKALTMPLDPMNEGHLRPLTVTAPENTLVAPSIARAVRIHMATWPKWSST
jgi:N-methylhydantoinase B/oxoprolinase/acetone carboxylase alpha subunit